jgi:hypothetical protein
MAAPRLVIPLEEIRNLPRTEGAEDYRGRTLIAMQRPVQRATQRLVQIATQRSVQTAMQRPVHATMQRPMPDLNGEAPATTALLAFGVSLGDIAASFPPQLFISTRHDGVVIHSSCSTPSRTPRTLRNAAGASSAYSGPIPKHLAIAIHEWLRAQGTTVSTPGNHGFITLQAKKLTIIQEARRTHQTKSSSQQRALVL